MVLCRVVHPNPQPDPLAQIGQLGLKLNLPTIDGEFSFSKTEFGKSVDKSLHEKLSPTDLTRLLLSPDSNLARLGQISIRSVQIWPDFDEIHRNLGQISTRFVKIFTTTSVKISTVEISQFWLETYHRWLKSKPTWPMVFGGWQWVSFSATWIWRVGFGLGHKPDPWTVLVLSPMQQIGLSNRIHLKQRTSWLAKNLKRALTILIWILG